MMTVENLAHLKAQGQNECVDIYQKLTGTW